MRGLGQVRETTRPRRRSVVGQSLRVGVALLLLAVSGCRTYDDDRILQVLNQRGFGRRSEGNSNEVFTVGVGDTIAFSDPINLELFGQSVVGIDGVIDVPLVGRVYVRGFSAEEIAQQLEQRYSEYYNNPRLLVTTPLLGIVSKRFYVRGEVLAGGVKEFKGNVTVWDAIMSAPIPITADLSDIELIRADPLHPLVIPIDLERMYEGGYSPDNIEIREDDIIIVNPNFAGHVKNFVQLLLSPIVPIVSLATSAQRLQFTYDSFTDDVNFNNRFGYGGVGGFNNIQGGNTFNATSGATEATNGGNLGGGLP